MFQAHKNSDEKEEFPQTVKKGSHKPQHSIIGRDLKITGDIVSTGDITVHGEVEGTITCRSLTLGDTPVISSVTAETVRISGVFDGEIRAKKVCLGRNARVTGNIYHESLEVEAGGSIEGKLARLGNKRAAAISKVATLEQPAPAKVSNG